MLATFVNNFRLNSDIREKQRNNIIFITFWSQFASYAFNTILILFLTRPIIAHGLGYSEARSYAFYGLISAMGYLMPVIGGYMADIVVGIRRAILIGSLLLAFAYLLVMLSGYTIGLWGDTLFIAACASIPVANSLLMGTASAMVSHIYSNDAVKAKSAMTYYYIAINIGALIATIIAPLLLESRYGPLSIFSLAFAGKSIAALNFAKRYAIYDSAIWGKDTKPFTKRNSYQLLLYCIGFYGITYFAYTHIYSASLLITIGCIFGIVLFIQKTFNLQNEHRTKQLMAIFLIVEAILFFVIYNQMNSTMILFAKNNSDQLLLGFKVSPAHYQLLNPLLILAIGSLLPKFYERFPRFNIPYQFVLGIILAGGAMLVIVVACLLSHNGIINGNYIALTYILITIAELWVSAIGLSMIGLYCDQSFIALAMGVWYLASSLSNIISARLAGWVAIPVNMHDRVQSLTLYKNYYYNLALGTLVIGIILFVITVYLEKRMEKNNIVLV